ncbi:RNA-binding domain-containing protein [Methanimicrococcus blatticola]|uniref:UPF0201 protein C7391_0536 n=1 Tax=Methanimicrococcus blatticola TaxID=91560 RepID=A0A484F4W7_9EURY|nr:RNA-binding domain-containing protein [Methanimicrococcus blatticola]MBZ3936108.1 hypothetical protein [Methanimicrococcus blatticola]MCC2508351.1 hypothetical protein [Methanimicrococcus blatticola]TDQ70196.1 hypothetical protein C7391_0536 [Methanimicrococcus blatticola]
MNMLNAKVTFFAPVYRTEDPEKVGAAVSNMANFGRPKSEEIRPDFISGTIPALDKIDCDGENIKQTACINGNLELLSGIHYLIRKEEIIDTANTAFKNGTDESGCQTLVALNKQAALMKHLSFPADVEPLGSVYLEIEAETPDALLKIIDWLTPPTKEGIPVYELKMNEL